MGVLNQKTWILIAVAAAFLVTSAFVMANVEMPAWASYISGLNVILFAVPVFVATLRWLGYRDAISLFVVLGVLALVIETAAILTGFPYGHFGYSDLLGTKLFGYVPWTVALAWSPLVIASYAMAARIEASFVGRVLFVAGWLMGMDLVIDPGAVRMGFWQYQADGEFYGVPLSNFAGWLVSGAIAGVVVELFVRWKKPLLPIPVQLISSAFFIILFWGALAFFTGMMVPAASAVALCAGIAIFYFRFHYSFDDIVVYADEQGNRIATAPKLPAHDGDTKLHLAFSVFLFNRKGEILLQQRALHKKTWPGVWSNSCCGHVMLHESFEDAAERRVRYELGLRTSNLEMILPEFRYRAEKDGVVENEICPVFVGFTDREPKPNPAEVNDTRWVPWEQFVRNVADPAHGYSPWAREEVELLSREPKFYELFENRGT